MITRFYEIKSDDEPITSNNFLSTVKDTSVIFQEGLEIVIDNKVCVYSRFKVVKVQFFVQKSEWGDKLKQEVFVARLAAGEKDES